MSKIIHFRTNDTAASEKFLKEINNIPGYLSWSPVFTSNIEDFGTLYSLEVDCYLPAVEMLNDCDGIAEVILKKNEDPSIPISFMMDKLGMSAKITLVDNDVICDFRANGMSIVGDKPHTTHKSRREAIIYAGGRALVFNSMIKMLGSLSARRFPVDCCSTKKVEEIF